MSLMARLGGRSSRKVPLALFDGKNSISLSSVDIVPLEVGGSFTTREETPPGYYVSNGVLWCVGDLLLASGDPVDGASAVFDVPETLRPKASVYEPMGGLNLFVAPWIRPTAPYNCGWLQGYYERDYGSPEQRGFNFGAFTQFGDAAPTHDVVINLGLIHWVIEGE